MKKKIKEKFRLIRDELEYFVYRPRRILFDHLPKCAGTTVTDYLLKHYPKRVVFRTNGRQPSTSVNEFQSLPKNIRYGYRLVLGHHTIKLLDYVHPDTIKITIFRDPVERIVSHYFFVKKDKQHYLHDRLVKLNIQLEDYVTSGLSPELQNWYIKHFTGLSDEEIEREPEKSVHRAAHVVLEKFDIIGFQDELPAVMQELRTAAQLNNQFENQVLNKRSEKFDIKKIPNNTQKIIAKVNSLDVELYNLLKTRVS